MWWILIGIVNLIAGLSGEFVLRGTESSGALVVVAVGMMGVGIFQLINKARKPAQQPEENVVVAEADRKDQP